MAQVLSITFTNAAGGSVSRSAGPDLATIANSALWEQRAQDTLMALAEERLGSTPPNIGAAVQSFIDEIYERLRAAEKRVRTQAAVEAAETAEDETIPDE